MSCHGRKTLPVVPTAEVPKRESIGLIGLGPMGSAMAERLVARGFEVLGFDIDAACLAALLDRGGRAGASVAQLAVSCPRIILSLPNSEAVQTVLEQLEPDLHLGQVIMDTTTGRPEAVLAAARRLVGRGVAYVEAMISGNSSQIRQGEVLIIAGGASKAITQCDDLFACFSSRVLYCGDSGSASKMKLVSNLVLGLNRAVLGEGLAFAGKLGLDLEQTLAVLRESMGYSRVMDTNGDKMIAGDFKPQARLSQHLKDVRLILGTAAANRARVPLSREYEQLLEQAEFAGLGAMDNSAIIQVFEPEA